MMGIWMMEMAVVRTEKLKMDICDWEVRVFEISAVMGMLR